MKYSLVRSTPDPRDLQYSAHLGADFSQLPRQADLRPYCSAVEDQGQTNSCTGHAIVGAMECDANIQGETPIEYSRLFVYWNERNLEGTTNQDGGAELRDGIKMVAQYGACEEKLWPFDESKVLEKPSLEAFEDALKHKAIRYEAIEQNQDALLHCLGLNQRPVVFGLMIFESFESQEVADSGIVPMPQWHERSMGGHALLIVGYDLDKQMFLIRNSWSKDWGQQGYCWVPFAYILNPQLALDFWTIVAID
jgi:C1A family cysteine protease